MTHLLVDVLAVMTALIVLVRTQGQVFQRAKQALTGNPTVVMASSLFLLGLLIALFGLWTMAMALPWLGAAMGAGTLIPML